VAAHPVRTIVNNPAPPGEKNADSARLVSIDAMKIVRVTMPPRVAQSMSTPSQR
jgi:hypothetical protein